MLEKRLIYEMAGLRGGKTKLAAIRDEYVLECERLEEAIEAIDEVCGKPEDTAVVTEREAVDSIGE